MCLAIVKPAGKSITRERLLNGFTSNNHGAGLAWAHKGKLHIEKGFFKFEEFYKKYEEVQALNLLIHFRIRTSGKQDAMNCHPWRVTENLALIHNGIIALKEEDNMSDTGVFTKYVLKPIVEAGPDLWRLKGIQWLIGEAVGLGNKIALMDNTGQTVIINEKQGNWDEGCWFSNYTYRGYSTRSYTGYAHDDSDWPASRYPAQSSCSLPVTHYSRRTTKDDTRWTETSIPNVYLLNKEHADKWKNAEQATRPTVDRTETTAELDERMLKVEIDRLKSDGWREWQPPTKATTETPATVEQAS